MDRIYASLIRKGLRTLDNIPAELKEKVAKILEEREQA